jgi:CheY-like chemotaxis protein
MARILIADDALPMRLLLCSVLQRDGHDVLAAVDGDAALDMLRREQPDVAILDLHMPGLSGLDVCRAARADPRLETVGLIVLSGDVTAAQRRPAEADAWLQKPFRPADLLHTINELLHVGSQVALPVGELREITDMAVASVLPHRSCAEIVGRRPSQSSVLDAKAAAL